MRIIHQPDTPENNNINNNFTEDSRELESAIEGILFASGEPVHIERFCTALGIEPGAAEKALNHLRDYYAFERRGMRLLKLDDKWQLCSAPDYADVIRKAFEIRKPAKLSQPALEALTIIAYYQPTTRAYVDKLRGVDSAYTVRLLEERGLIEACGRLAVPGRPVLYRTTEQFLRAFHISSLEELPPLPEGEGFGPPSGELPEGAEPIKPGDSNSNFTPNPDAQTPENMANDTANPDLENQITRENAEQNAPENITNPENHENIENINRDTLENHENRNAESIDDIEHDDINNPEEITEPDSENIPRGGLYPGLYWGSNENPERREKRKKRRPDRKKVKKRKDRIRRGVNKNKKQRHGRRSRIRPRRKPDANSKPDSEPPGEPEQSPDLNINNMINIPDRRTMPELSARRIWRGAGRCMKCLFYGLWVSWPLWLLCC